MERFVHLIAFSLMAVLLLPAAALAAEVTQADVGTDAPVVFYEHGLGNGKTYEPAVPSSEASLELDETISNVFIGRDDIIVTLYEHKDFGGNKIQLDTPGMHTMPSYGFNDKASSFEITLKPSASKVTFYEHIEGGGWSFDAANPSAADLSEDHNDQVSSVLIEGDDVAVVLYEHITAGGRSLTLDAPGLYDLMQYDFNDIVSSYEVRAK